MKKTIYLSGNVTGVSEQLTEKFNRASDKLIAAGNVVLTPLASVNLKGELSVPHERLDTYEKQMKQRLRHLLSCDVLYLLPCWNECRGVQLERDTAMRLGMQVVYL